MFEVNIINRITGEDTIIYTHYRTNPFADNPEYDSDEWIVSQIVYID